MKTAVEKRKRSRIQKRPPKQKIYSAAEIRAAIRYILSRDTTTPKLEFADSIRRQFNRTHSLSDKQTTILFEIYNSLKDEQL